jgi:N-acetylneuraminic acid mutarotase
MLTEERGMPRRAIAKKDDAVEFILTAASEHKEFPGVWGFEVFTNRWQKLARFTYKSEAEAAWALKHFAWVMGRISSAVTV